MQIKVLFHMPPKLSPARFNHVFISTFCLIFTVDFSSLCKTGLKAEPWHLTRESWFLTRVGSSAVPQHFSVTSVSGQDQLAEPDRTEEAPGSASPQPGKQPRSPVHSLWS